MYTQLSHIERVNSSLSSSSLPYRPCPRLQSPHRHLPPLSILGQLLHIFPRFSTSLQILVFHSSRCSPWPAPFPGYLRIPLQCSFSNTGFVVLNVCPIHRHLLCPMPFPMEFCPVLFHISSFLILSPHFIRVNLRRHLFTNVWCLFVFVREVFHVSDPSGKCLSWTVSVSLYM